MRFGFFKYLSVSLGVGDGHCKERFAQVSIFISATYPFQSSCLRPRNNLVSGGGSDDADPGFRLQKLLYLCLGHLVPADHNANSALQVQEQRVEGAHT